MYIQYNSPPFSPWIADIRPPISGNNWPFKREQSVHHYSTHFSMSSSDSCAVGPDGKLLDASEITWFNDPDDAHPIPGPDSGTPAAGSSSVFAIMMQAGRTSTTKIAGGRRSTSPRRSSRCSKPSAKLREANESKSAGKRKTRDSSRGSPARQSIMRRRIDNADVSDGTSSLFEGDGGYTTEPVEDTDAVSEEEGPSFTLEELKAMGSDAPVRLILFPLPSLLTSKFLRPTLRRHPRHPIYSLYSRRRTTSLIPILVRSSVGIFALCASKCSRAFLVLFFTIYILINQSRGQGAPAKDYFMTGSSSSLRAHIRRYDYTYPWHRNN
jgi:hypothetical protein